jgi:hypothetical protein
LISSKNWFRCPKNGIISAPAMSSSTVGSPQVLGSAARDTCQQSQSCSTADRPSASMPSAPASCLVPGRGGARTAGWKKWTGGLAGILDGSTGPWFHFLKLFSRSR